MSYFSLYLGMRPKWLFFGGEGCIAENDPVEQDKRVRYRDVVANCVVYQNVVDMTRILADLAQEGVTYTRADLAALSPYLTRHLKRFGDYVIDLSVEPPPLDDNLTVPDSAPVEKPTRTA